MRPGLTNWPESDKELKTIADSMWGKAPAKRDVRYIGKGLLAWGSTPAGVQGDIVVEDFEAPDENDGLEFIHRVVDGADFYFVSNQSNRVKHGRLPFPSPHRTPELWDPVTGICRKLATFDLLDDTTVRIPMTFEPYQSFFVVFRKSANWFAQTGWKAELPRVKTTCHNHRPVDGRLRSEVGRAGESGFRETRRLDQTAGGGHQVLQRHGCL